MKPDCEAIRSLLPLVLLGEAEPLDAARVGDHISACFGCREESGRLSRLLGSLGMAGVPDPGAGYWESFLPRLRNRIAMQGLAPGPGSRRQAWAVAAGVSVLLLGAAAAMALQPSAENRQLMALDYLAARTDPETLSRTLDEILPGSDLSLPDRSADGPALPRPAEIQKALDTLLPEDDGDLCSAANDLSPEARRWLLKALMLDRV